MTQCNEALQSVPICHNESGIASNVYGENMVSNSKW